VAEHRPEDGMDYKTWAMAKWKEVKESLNPCNTDGELDPIRLNEVLVHFGSHFSWAITVMEIEANELNIMQSQFDAWYRRLWAKADRKIRDETGSTTRPVMKSVEAKAAVVAGSELEEREDALVQLRSRVDLLRGFVKVLEKQANILQTLSSNMRSEMFFAGGIPIGTNLTQEQKTSKAKGILRQSMKSLGEN